MKPLFLFTILLIESLSLATEQNQISRFESDYRFHCLNSAGGILRAGRCVCPAIDTHVDPYNGVCPNALLESNKLLPSAPKCELEPNEQHRRQFPPPITAVKEDSFCVNPAKFLCQPSINPAMRDSYETQALYRHYVEEAKRLPGVIDHFDKEGVVRVSQLSDPLKNRVIPKMNEHLRDKLFTENRMSIARTQFENAKKQVLILLNHKLDSLKKNEDVNRAEAIVKSIASIKKIQLTLPRTDTDLISSNATYDAQSDSLLLEGAILYADHNQDELFFIFAHELGHRIYRQGWDNYYLDTIKNSLVGSEDLNSHPFGDTIDCLTHPQSIGTKSVDFACLRDLAKKFQDSNPNLTHEIEDARKRCERFPSACGFGLSITGEPCNMGQSHEAFADWIATESVVGSIKSMGNDFDKRHSVLGQDSRGINYIDLKYNPTFHHLSGFVSLFCSGAVEDMNQGLTRGTTNHTHPIDQDRINRIFLAHPFLRNALGCSKEYSHDALPGQSEAVDPKKTLYCRP